MQIIALAIDQSQFAKKSELNEFRSTLNITVDQRAEIAVSRELGRIHEAVYDEVEKLRTLIYQEKDDLKKQIEDKATEVQGEFAEENSKLKDEMNSEHSKLKTQLENLRTELGDEISTLKKDLEAVKKASDSKEESIEQLKRELKQIDVNKDEAMFVFEVDDFKYLLNSDGDTQSNKRVSEFFQCRGMLWVAIYWFNE